MGIPKMVGFFREKSQQKMDDGTGGPPIAQENPRNGDKYRDK